MTLHQRQESGETRVTPWVNTRGKAGWEKSTVSAYRIWIMFDGLRWWQRHEWQRHDGSSDLDDWIRGISGFPTHAVPVPA